MKGYVGRNNILFGESKAIADTLIICEGEIDLISVKQMLAPLEAKYKRNINIVSSMLGASSTVEALLRIVSTLLINTRRLFFVQTRMMRVKKPLKMLGLSPQR